MAMKESFRQQFLGSRWSRAAALFLAMVLPQMNAGATTVTTIAGGPPKAAGYVDGETAVDSRFNDPMGMAFDTSGYLYVADYNNNAIRQMDLVNDLTWTFATGSHPVGITIDQHDNMYVLYYGKGTNGMVVQYDVFGDIIATNATGLPFAGGIAADFGGDVYVTSSNQVVEVVTSQGDPLWLTIPYAGSLLKGITVMGSGLLGVADSGRNGIYTVNPSGGSPYTNVGGGPGNIFANTNLIPFINPGIITTNAGFNGAGDAFGSANRAKFLNPSGLLSVGNDSLIVADSGNNRVKVINNTGIVTNLYGVDSNYWAPTSYSPTPGLWDGTVMYGPPSLNYNFSNYVEARFPVGLAMDSAGTLYASEDYYHVIRTVTAAGLPHAPTPPAKVAAPKIGIVTYDYDPTTGQTLSVFNPIPDGGLTNLYNNAIIVVWGDPGAQTYFDYTNSYPISTLADPTTSFPSVPYTYQDASTYSYNSMLAPEPHLFIKAMSAEPGAPSSDVTSARINYTTANPYFSGNNAASFTIGDATIGATIYYTIDGSDPSPLNGNLANGNISQPMTSTNLLVKAVAYQVGYSSSAIVSNLFTIANFVPNVMTFGFAAGEGSSVFVASPGQSFFAPITLTLLPATKIYSMQFNVTVTNAGPNPGPALVPASSYLSFQSALEKPNPSDPGFDEWIPPAMYLSEVPIFGITTNMLVNTNYIPPVTNVVTFTNIVGEVYAQNPPPTNEIFYYDGYPFLPLGVVNSGENLLAVGWLERYGESHLYNTKSQDLITFSQAHDVQYLSSAGKVEVGDYSFVVPSNAVAGQTYKIQIGRPSATSDGVGAPGGDLVLVSPTNGSLTAGAINGTKIVTVGQIKYLVGDCAPFRWFNAGDFGDTNLDNADVMQVFQAVAYSLDYPPLSSDFFDSMDSCGSVYVDNGNGYLENGGSFNTNLLNNLFSGNDTSINQIAFGDGNLDVCDIYVTFRRSLDPGLLWFQRFWTNGVRVAQIVPNVTPNAVKSGGSANRSKNQASTNVLAQVNFAAADFQVVPGQTINVPITAQIVGSFPLRVLALSLSVRALDGSPQLTTPVQFTANPALGTPLLVTTNGDAGYASTWLDSTIAGLTGTASIGTLQITIPTNATGNSAYDIHFDHVSGSPNGLASFPKQILPGLITLSSRTNSSFGDGIPDSWRLRWFGTTKNVLSVSNAVATTDGINNWQKYVAGVDPTIPNDFPNLLPKASIPSGSTSAIHWPTVSGKQYIIERSFSLYGGWTPVTTNTGTGTDMEFDDSAAGGARFYRVQILP